MLVAGVDSYCVVVLHWDTLRQRVFENAVACAACHWLLPQEDTVEHWRFEVLVAARLWYCSGGGPESSEGLSTTQKRPMLSWPEGDELGMESHDAKHWPWTSQYARITDRQINMTL